MLNTVNPVQSAPISLPNLQNARSIAPAGQSLADTVQFDTVSAPVSPQPTSLGLLDWVTHPIESYKLSSLLKTNMAPGESFGTRLAMYKAIKSRLSTKGKANLYQQLLQGRLTDTKADNNRSTLTHLFNIIATPRAKGLDGDVILEDVLRLMNAPQTITQKFGTLKDANLQALMQYYHSGQGPQITSPIDINTLRVNASATCVASSLMYYMVSKCPSEFSRHIAELTSPSLAFNEKANLAEISPEDPSQAAKKLNDYGIPAAPISGTNNTQYIVKVNLPYSGLVRAVNQQGSRESGSRGVVEAAYQGALTHLVVRSYDPGLDMRVNPDGTLDPSKGLEEDRKTLMESIIKDNGGVMSVTYHFTASNRDNEPYLMGYYRSFEETTQDLISAIDAGEQVIIGITDTDRSGTTGRINMGHELNVVGYTKDAKTGEVIFNIADSDDNNPNLVQRRASEIVPKIHHAGFPVKQAQKIWNDINSKLNNQYFLPDESDSKRFQLISTVPAKEQPAFLDEYQKILQEQEAQQPSADVAPQLTQPALAQQQSPLPHWQPQWQPAFMPQMYNWQAGYAVPRQTYSQQQTWQAPQPWGYTPYANTAYATYNYQYAAYGPQSSTYAIASNPFAQQQAQYYPTATGYTHPYAAYANYR